MREILIAALTLTTGILASGGQRNARLGALFVAWTALYLLVSKVVDGEHTLAQTASLVWRSINDGLMPAVAGGPWLWDRWVPSPPMATGRYWDSIPSRPKMEPLGPSFFGVLWPEASPG